MDWEAQDKERRKKIDEERKRLLAISDYDAEKLPIPERYQRIRYLREIEAAKWLEEERRKIRHTEPDKPITRRYSRSSKVIYNHD